MIENRPWLTIFSHTMLILGIAVILFPLYVAFVAATLDKQAVYAAPMTLIPGTYLLENIHNIWVNGVGTNSAPFWRMLLNSFVMAFSITLGKITVSMLSAFAIVWFRFPLRNLFFWMIFITLMLPVEVRIFPTVEVIANLKMLDSYAGLTLPLMASATAICTSDNSLCPEDALASSLRKISNFSWFSLFTFAAKLFRFVCGNNHGRSILHPDRISDYGGDYRHGCPLPRKPLLTIILFPPAPRMA